MAEHLPIQINAVKVERSDDRFIVTIGAANGTTSQWVLGVAQAALLVNEIHDALPGEVPVE